MGKMEDSGLCRTKYWRLRFSLQHVHHIFI